MPDSRDGLLVCPVLITGSYLELRLNLLEIGLCWRPNSMRWHAEGHPLFLPGTNLELLIQRLESRMSCEMSRLIEVACFGASFLITYPYLETILKS
jgi:hypothetical protein